MQSRGRVGDETNVEQFIAEVMSILDSLWWDPGLYIAVTLFLTLFKIVRGLREFQFTNRTPASRSSDFVDYRPNWTQLGPITITSRMEVSWSLAGLQVLEFLLILLLMFIVPVNLLSVKQRFPSLKISTIYGNFFYPLNSACLKKGENRRGW